MYLWIRLAPDTFSVHSNTQTFKNHHRFLTALQNRYVQQTALAITSNINNALIYLPEYMHTFATSHYGKTLATTHNFTLQGDYADKRQRLYAFVPKAVINAIIIWWIIASLVSTTRTLRIRRKWFILSRTIPQALTQSGFLSH